MQVIKGYSIPRPGAGDGEYGGFADYSASPSVRPYWAGRNIAKPIPSLDGYGEALATQQVTEQMQSQAAAGKGLLFAGAGAVAGYLYGRNPVAALLGAGAGMVLHKLFGKQLGTVPLTIDEQETLEEARAISPETQAYARYGELLPGWHDGEWSTPIAYEVPGFSPNNDWVVSVPGMSTTDARAAQEASRQAMLRSVQAAGGSEVAQLVADGLAGYGELSPDEKPSGMGQLAGWALFAGLAWFIAAGPIFGDDER